MENCKVKKRGIVLLTEDLCPQWIDFMKQAKLNVLGIHVIASNGRSESTDAFLEWLDRPETRALLERFEAEGIEIEYELHAMSWLMDRKHFAEHPEWFRMAYTGERTPDVNFCGSSKEAMRIVRENTYKLASRIKQKSHRYYFWLDDTQHNSCHCLGCSGKSYSDQSVLILNEMLKGLKEYDPEATLAYLAYRDSLKPPTIKPDPDLFLEFAPIERDLTKPLDDQPDSPVIKQLDDLLEVFDKDTAHILEYWFDDSLFSHYKKPPIKLPFYDKVMEQDVKIYTSRGISFITSFGAFLGPTYMRLHGIPPIDKYGDILYNAK